MCFKGRFNADTQRRWTELLSQSQGCAVLPSSLPKSKDQELMRRERKGVDFGEWESGEDLGGVRGGEAIIRRYCCRKTFSIKNNSGNK